MKKFFEFYKIRKIVSIGILIGVVLSIIFLIEQREVFLKFVDDEYDFKVIDGEEEGVKLSGQAQLELYNRMFITEVTLLSVMGLVISSSIVGLFTERWNGNKQFKYMVILSLLLFVVLVVHISLKPIESSKQVGTDGLGVPLFEILEGPIYSQAYWVLYISMGTFVASIYARKKFGNLRNDTIIKAADTTIHKGVRNV